MRVRSAATILVMSISVLAATSPARADARLTIGAGDFTPVLSPAAGQTRVHVAAFRLDARPVTNTQYLEFVRANPVWRRDRVAKLFADEGYLSQWSAADALGAGALPDQPVTRVSWFAARAYCEAAGGRLPEWNEWEVAAAADEQTMDARADVAWRARILDWYSRPATDPLQAVGLQRPNLYGIHDLHGLIWEWVDDFTSLMVSGDSRNQGDADKLEFCGAGSISAQDRENYPVLMRIAFLSALDGRSTARRLGFRCAENVPESVSRDVGATSGIAHRGGGEAESHPAPHRQNGLSSASTAVAQDQAFSIATGTAVPGDSLYQLDIPFETAAGGLVPMMSFRGRPLLITMFYGRCNSVCPMLAHQLQLLERRLAPQARTGMRIVMVSLDPEHDTPAELSQFAQLHHIGGPSWVIARTSRRDVRQLAAALGVRYRQLPDGSFNHSTVIALADAQGVIRSRTTGIAASDDELLTAANSMFAAAAASRQGGGAPPH